MNTSKIANRRIFVTASLVSVSGVGTYAFCVNQATITDPDKDGTSAVSANQVTPERLVAWITVQTRLTNAKPRRQRAVVLAEREFQQFMFGAIKGCGAFSKQMFSFGSKWKYLTYSKTEYQKYLQRQFSKYVFSTSQLQNAITNSIKTCIRELDKIDNQLLISIRQDLSNHETLRIPSIKSQHSFTKHVNDAALHYREIANTELGLDVGGLVASEIATVIAFQIMRTVAIRMGVSSAILGAGAVGSTVTFGGALVAGVIVDFIVQSIIGVFWDAKGELTRKIQQTLRKIDSEVRIGTKNSPGLRPRFTAISNSSHKVLQNALKDIILYS